MDIPASALMDTNPLQCNSDEKIGTVINLMRKRKVDYSLVRLWEELQGIITYRDIMRIIVKPPERQIPVYMVGLPDDPFEAETAQTKFTNVIHILSKRFPSIEEARSKIKSGKQKGERRKRYEVSVVIKTSKRMYSYSETGWDLPVIYDKISSRLKRLLTQKRVRKRDVRGIRPS
jgi:hypothetical protein